MPARSFFDSSVLVYTDDRDAPAKQRRALDLLEEARLHGTGVLSTQVLEEYFSAATRKLRVDAIVVRQKVELFARYHVVVIQPDDILAAIDLHRLHQLAIWDALILRAALHSGCAVLYSEDFQPGWEFGGLTIVNPFK